ncbi:MAG: HlyD family efflux transporter periplasmic adaptor subunit [Ideonella sp.]
MTAPSTAVVQAAVQRDRQMDVPPTLGHAESAPTSTERLRPNRLLSMPLILGKRSPTAAAPAVDIGDSRAAVNPSERVGEAGYGNGADLHAVITTTADPVKDAGLVLQLQDTFLRQPNLAAGALALTNELARVLACERVTLGVIDGREVDVIAVSNSAEFRPAQELMRQIAAALREAVDQGNRVTYPVMPADPIRIVLAHADLHERSGHALASVALVAGGQSVGALLAEWRGAEPPEHRRLELLDSMACALGPLLALRQIAERPWSARGIGMLHRAWQAITRRQDPTPKVLALTLLVGLLAAVFLPVSYRIGAPGRIEGAVQRVIAAPLDGYLAKANVRPGDSVRAGDVLVELADQDLLLEQRRWEGALAQHENGYAAALARSDRAQFVIAQGKAGEARAQLELVRQQLARTRLLAPIDGVVIKGDLSQGLGAPVQRGDALITLAPAERYRLIINVDERDIASVRPGQRGQLALASSPGDPLRFVVERVTPVATVQDGRNTFEVEARLLAAAPLLRPGLQGVAKIDAGERSTAWIWTHRGIDWLRLSLWSWGP